MAIIVVGGGGRGAGKTALICGLIRATPQYRWTAVKITTHAHGLSEPVHEEAAGRQTTDTSRYLAAGARRALLIAAHDDTLAEAVNGILKDHLPSGHLVFESNRVLKLVRPTLCLAVSSDLKGGHKSSFDLIERCADATVALAGHDHVIAGERIHFHLRSLERISPTMADWLHEKLRLE